MSTIKFLFRYNVVAAVITTVALALGVYALYHHGGGINRKMSESAAGPRAYVVNVLAAPYYHDMHIKGSIHVPFEDLVTVAAKWDHATPVVLYCSNRLCAASGAGVRQLRKQGFTNVRAYEGGMAEWYHLSQTDPGYGVVGNGQESYLHEEPRAAHHDNTSHEFEITAVELRALMHETALLDPAYVSLLR